MNPAGRGYDPNRNNAFSVASVVFGVLSLIFLCTGIFAIPFGALGLIFVSLTYRRGYGMPPLSTVGLALSLLGLLVGIMLTAWVTVTTVIPMMTDPNYFEKMNEMYKSQFGIDLSQYYNMK